MSDMLEELQALMKALEAGSQYGSPLQVEPLEIALGGCNHVWKPYIGFTEKYDFCEKCGVKNE